MYKNQFILVIFLSCSLVSVAQQNNNWYFGKKAGLSFNSVPNQQIPSPLFDGEMVADEGCSSISDENGDLLFYTNGITVYNRDHQVMLNGDGLAANISTAQSSVIIPVPGNDSIFYIFTADAIENQFANGYRYSIVNLAGDNGKGQVSFKNTLLWPSGSERMTAVRHADGIGVWLITNDNNSNIFRSWLITCNGLQTTPVVSATGVVMDQHYYSNCGLMKVSPDGKQLCQTHFPKYDELNYVPNFIQLFDFNNASGVISNPRSIGYPNAQFTSCEYSPDSKLLYLSRTYDKAVDQLEVTLPTTAAIRASRITINTGNYGYLGIQLGPDEKIYLTSSSTSWWLGVINSPNIKGLGCNFQADQVDLNPRFSFLGFPGSINDLSINPLNGFTYSILDSCLGQVQFQGFSNMSGALQWEWDFGDGSTSTLQNPVHSFTPAGQAYSVKLKISSSLLCGRILVARIIKPGGVVFNLDFTMVNRCDSGYVRFVNKSFFLQSPFGQFLWDFGDGNSSSAINPVHSYAVPGSYIIKLKLLTGNSCLDDSISYPLDLSSFSVQASPDQTILVGQTVTLSVAGSGNIFQWLPDTWISNPAIRSTEAMPLDDITYTVTVTNQEGCISKDSVFIKVLPLDDVYVPTGFTPNNDGRNDLIYPWYSAQFVLSEFSIFNRWGQKMFSTRERGKGWNGKINGMIQDTGVYVWVVRAVDKDGVKIERKGSFVLIR